MTESLEVVAGKYFSGGEIKSSNVGPNDDRRIQILMTMSKMNYRFGSLVVDKSRIKTGGGLRFQRSFFKSIHRKLFDRFFQAFSNTDIRIDNYGDRVFMDEFHNYARGRFIAPDLFSALNITFVPSDSNRIIQLADFVSGSLARVFDIFRRSTRAKEIWQILKPHVLWIDDWPPSRFGLSNSQARLEPENEQIIEIARRTLINFIDNNRGSSDHYVKAQMETLNRLDFICRYIDPQKYVSTDELISDLREIAGIVIRSKDDFWYNVVEPLKDAGVLIVSSSKGYKIPVSTGEIREFVRNVDHRVTPQLIRLNVMRGIIRAGTDGRVNILDSYDHLEALIEAAREIPR